MPLFPTMYAQLCAIAKEFNFPSTAGICLYLQYTEAGMTLTPRISDDSWAHLWGNALESRSPQPGLPISGRIEFDIDLHQARWYNIWLSSPNREHVEIPRSVSPSLIVPRVGLTSHARQDSRTTFAEDTIPDEMHDRELPVPPATLVRKHIPRKLSLVDRFDALSTKSGTRTAAPATISPPEIQVRTHALSPIVQEDEPRTARQDLQSRVNTWRASASLQAPSPFLAIGQTSLDPINMPNHIDLDEEKLNLDDFTWSVSSLGPGDSPLESIASWDRVQSVHLDRRLQASVCLTPSVCTSFGPPTGDMDDMHYLLSPYLATPDIARRQLSDCPLTPSTVTSWGPNSYPASPLDLYGYPQAPSIHLQDRATFSRPVTPTTATTWGPPSVYAPSPRVAEFIRTPDIGERSFDAQRSLPTMTWPSESPEERQPWGQVWPYVQSAEVDTVSADVSIGQKEEVEAPVPSWRGVWPYISSTTEAQESADVEIEDQRFRSHVWPHTTSVDDIKVQSTSSWQHVWPYSSADLPVLVEQGAVARKLASAPQPASQESESAWRHSWPYTSTKAADPAWKFSFPAYDASEQQLRKTIWPYNLATSSKETNAPQTWQHIWPYGRRTSLPEGQMRDHIWPYNMPVLSEKPLAESGPWKRVWPYTASQEEERSVVTVSHAAAPSTWNHGWPYNASSAPGRSSLEDGSPTWQHNWPQYSQSVSSDLVAAKQPASFGNDWLKSIGSISGGSSVAAFGRTHVWPYNGSSNTTDRTHSSMSPASRGAKHVPDYPWNLSCIYSVVIRSQASAKAKNAAPARKRMPAYPWNLEEIYPAREEKEMSSGGLGYPLNLANIYPSLGSGGPGYPMNLANIYPPVRAMSPAQPNGNPHNLMNIYPPVSTSRRVCSSRSTPVAQGFLGGDQSQYPWNLNNIYPSANVISNSAPADPQNLYAIYPPVQDGSVSRQSTPASRTQMGYPHNLRHIYPAPQGTSKRTDSYSPASIAMLGYPQTLYEIYPPLANAVFSQAIRSSHTDTEYPQNLRYIYPAVQGTSSATIAAPGYPQHLFEIYPPVTNNSVVRQAIRFSNPALGYPHNLRNIYPASGTSKTMSSYSPAFSAVHGYPENLNAIYPPVANASVSGQAAPSLRTHMAYPHNLRHIYPPHQSNDELARMVGAVDKKGYPDNLKFIYSPVYQRGPMASRKFVEYPFNLLCLHGSPEQHTPASVSSKDYPFNLSRIYMPKDQRVCAIDEAQRGYPDNLPNIYVRLDTGKIDTLIGAKGYPHNLFEIYPPHRPTVDKTSQDGYPHNLSGIYQPLEERTASQDQQRGGYPDNLFNIYPSVGQHATTPQLSCNPQEYPWNVYSIFHPYESIMPSATDYPHNLLAIYPSIQGLVAPSCNGATTASGQLTSTSNSGDAGYPSNLMNIYANPRPSLHHTSPYPWNICEIYSASLTNAERPAFIPSERLLPLVQVSLPSTYPNLVIYAPIYPANLASIYPATTVTQSSQQSPSHYPTFSLYHSSSTRKNDVPYSTPSRRVQRRTHAELVGIVIIERSRRLPPPLKPSTEVNALRLHRKTHAELHAQVMWASSKPLSAPQSASPKRSRFVLRPSWSKTGTPGSSVDLSTVAATSISTVIGSSATQPEVHDTRDPVFPPGVVDDALNSSISGSSDRTSRNLTSLRTSRLHSARTSLPPPLAPSPSTRLPPVPASPASPSSASRRSSKMRHPSSPRPGGPRPLSTHRAYEPPTPKLSLEKAPILEAETFHPSVQPRVGYRAPPRTMSMALPSNPAVNLSRSNTTPKHSHARRESLVMQRVRAFNNSSVDEIPIDTLSQFPAPPRPPLPVGKLDRSKLPFA